ncbi:hypothetical protein BFINE_34290 [Bacteroides finegoldii DSM 17565]|nr:hypothetical protein BFINE_34290 [Bacteroides finegoldii DSM 17565]
MADYKVNFKDLKARVGVDDIAYALGYRLDRKAGVGRYIELVLGRTATGVTPSLSAIPTTRRHRPFSAGTVQRVMWSR